MNRLPRLPALVLAVLTLGAGRLAAAAPPPRPLGGDAVLERMPESAGLRARNWEGFLAAGSETVLAAAPRTAANEFGAWSLSSVRAKDYFYLIVAPGKGGDFPLYAQGSWIVKRSYPGGRFVQAKVFLRSDPGTFLRLYPDGDRSRMDLVLYGGALAKDVPLPVPFERLLRASVAEIAAWSRDSVDWSLFSPRPGLYADTRRLAEGIRSRLPSLAYRDDGALDAEGRPVLIATGAPQAGAPGLNCSGFAKWVADGLRGPAADGGPPWLDPRAMARRHEAARGSSFTAPFEESLDPFFGLDWTRNLAKALSDARSPSRDHGILEADVRLSPFALYSPSSDPVNGGSPYEDYPPYEENLGFQARGLKALLYVLAAREPGSVYFASLSRADKDGMRRHYHVALLAPYFEASGEFRVAVFESAAETSLEALVARGPKDFVHLVRVRAESSFDPPPFPARRE